ELFEAVWPDVSVCDDSLVQCIRELRQKLGDEDRRLIKTVSRRGYMLDVAVGVQVPQGPSGGLAVKSHEKPRANATMPVMLPSAARTMSAPKLRMWGAIAAVLTCVVLAGEYLFGWPVSLAIPGRVSVVKNAPVALQSRPSFKDCSDCPE